MTVGEKRETKRREEEDKEVFILGKCWFLFFGVAGCKYLITPTSYPEKRQKPPHASKTASQAWPPELKDKMSKPKGFPAAQFIPVHVHG